MQCDLCGRSAKRIEAGLPGSGEGMDVSVWSHLADAVVIGVGDIKIAGAVKSEALRPVELGLGCGAAVPAKAGPRITGNQSNGATGIEAKDRVQAGEIEVARAIGRDPLRRAD